MRTFPLVCALTAGLCAQVACTGADSSRESGKSPTLAERAGGLVYKAGKQARKGADAAAKDLSKTTAELRKGYKEARKSDNQQ